MHMSIPVVSDYLLPTFIFLPFIAALIAAFVRGRVGMIITSLSFIPIIVYQWWGIFTNAKYLVYLGTLPSPIGDVYLIYDGLSNAFAFAVALIAATLEYASYPYMKHRFEALGMPEQFNVYYPLFTLCAASMLLMIYSYNLLLIYICMEIALISSSLLIYFYGYGIFGKTKEWIAVMYFLYGAISGLLFLIGSLLIAFDNGTMSLTAIKTVSGLAWLLILIGMLVKLPSFGPHVWIPWAHGQHPTPVAALIIAIVGLTTYVLARIYMISPWFIDQYRIPILLYGLIGGLIISLGVFRHKFHYKWFLAYSTAANSAYLLIGLTLGPLGILGMTAHYISHLFGKAVLFMTAAAIIVYYEVYSMDKMGGLQTYMPSIGSAALLGFMALSGVLTLSMLAEFFIFAGYFDVLGLSPDTIGIFIGLVALFILTGYYSFWGLKYAFYGHPRGEYHKVKVDPKLVVPLYILGITAVMLLFPPFSTSLVASVLNSITVRP